MEKKRYHLIFKGNVQGVGFRFTTQSIARKYGITGWVRNNPDRTVEVVAEADEQSLGFFLKNLKEYFSHNIYDYTKNESAASGEFDSFGISF